MSRTRDDLLNFISHLANEGRVPSSTALSRKASVRKVLSILTDAEAQDVTLLDIDEVMHRFLAHNDHSYSLATKVSYKSRLQSSIDEFRAFLANPADRSAAKIRPRITAGEQALARIASITGTLAIPVRAGSVVEIRGLPLDLTEAEARRIGKVIAGYAESDAS